MAPKERKKPPRIQKQSYSLDSPDIDRPEFLCRTTSVTLPQDVSKEEELGPAWLRRSKEKLGETPEYLIRTGSMRSKKIEDRNRDTEHPTVPVDSSYTSYVVQTGCYMWTGRSYHRDSYIVHRREGGRAVTVGATGGRAMNWGDTYVRSGIMGQAERIAVVNRKDTEEIKVNRRDTVEKIITRGGDVDSAFSKSVSEQGFDVKNIKGEPAFRYDRPLQIVQKSSSNIASDDQTRTETVRKDDKFEQCEGQEKCSINVKLHADSDTGLLNDDIKSNRKAYKQITLNRKVQEKKHSNTGLEVSVEHVSQDKTDKQLAKQVKEDTVFTINENCKINKPVCSFQTQSLPAHAKTKLPHLKKRMKEQIKILLEKQLEVDYQIVTNELFARDIAAKLTNLAGDKEVGKFNLHIHELDSVNNLVLGLAARLAKVEENIDMLKVHKSETYSEIELLWRKKEKLIEQLSEAQWIKNNIDRRSRKIERSIERYLGGGALLSFKEFIIKKEKLISDRKELSDKMKLSKRQMLELDFGKRRGLDEIY